MISHRKGEKGSIPFRSGRFFNIDTDWYFACREGKDLGPYRNREDAIHALNSYLAKSRNRTPEKPSSNEISSVSSH